MYIATIFNGYWYNYGKRDSYLQSTCMVGGSIEIASHAVKMSIAMLYIDIHELSVRKQHALVSSFMLVVHGALRLNSLAQIKMVSTAMW